MRALFLADTHLSSGRDARGEWVASLLAREAQGGEASLFLLGDIFDAWCGAGGEKTLPKGPVLDGILAWGRRCGPVHWLEGNHDFHLAGAFPESSGVTVWPGPMDTVLDGVSFHLAHGDEVNRQDRGYLWLRQVFRSPAFFHLARWAGPTLLQGGGHQLSRLSRDGKPAARRDWGPVVEAWGRQQRAQVVVVGHGHRLGCQRLEGEGRWLVELGEWWEARSFARWRDGSLSLHRLQGEGGGEEEMARISEW